MPISTVRLDLPVSAFTPDFITSVSASSSTDCVDHTDWKSVSSQYIIKFRSLLICTYLHYLKIFIPYCDPSCISLHPAIPKFTDSLVCISIYSTDMKSLPIHTPSYRCLVVMI